MPTTKAVNLEMQSIRNKESSVVKGSKVERCTLDVYFLTKRPISSNVHLSYSKQHGVRSGT